MKDFRAILRELLDTPIEPRWTLASIARRMQTMGVEVDRSTLSKILHHDPERLPDPSWSIAHGLELVLLESKKNIAERENLHATAVNSPV